MGSPHHCVLKKHHPEVSTKPPPPCVTRMLLLWSLTTAPACARPVSPETTLPAPSSPPSSAAPQRPAAGLRCHRPVGVGQRDPGDVGRGARTRQLYTTGHALCGENGRRH